MTLRLTVEALDLGPDVRAVGIELVDPETEEPVGGAEAAPLWSHALASLAGAEPWTIDFFAHLDRVREFCVNNDVRFRETAAGGLAVTEHDSDRRARLFARFASETFGVRAGEPVGAGDPEVEQDLRRRGLDAYHRAYPRYFFCALCELETGSVTIVSEKLWASETARRLRAALKEFPVSVEMLM